MIEPSQDLCLRRPHADQTSSAAPNAASCQKAVNLHPPYLRSRLGAAAMAALLILLSGLPLQVQAQSAPEKVAILPVRWCVLDKSPTGQLYMTSDHGPRPPRGDRRLNRRLHHATDAYFADYFKSTETPLDYSVELRSGVEVAKGTVDDQRAHNFGSYPILFSSGLDQDLDRPIEYIISACADNEKGEYIKGTRIQSTYTKHCNERWQSGDLLIWDINSNRIADTGDILLSYGIALSSLTSNQTNSPRPPRTNRYLALDRRAECERYGNSSIPKNTPLLNLPQSHHLRFAVPPPGECPNQRRSSRRSPAPSFQANYPVFLDRDNNKKVSESDILVSTSTPLRIGALKRSRSDTNMLSSFGICEGAPLYDLPEEVRFVDVVKYPENSFSIGFGAQANQATMYAINVKQIRGDNIGDAEVGGRTVYDDSNCAAKSWPGPEPKTKPTTMIVNDATVNRVKAGFGDARQNKRYRMDMDAWLIAHEIGHLLGIVRSTTRSAPGAPRSPIPNFSSNDPTIDNPCIPLQRDSKTLAQNLMQYCWEGRSARNPDRSLAIPQYEPYKHPRNPNYDYKYLDDKKVPFLANAKDHLDALKAGICKCKVNPPIDGSPPWSCANSASPHSVRKTRVLASLHLVDNTGEWDAKNNPGDVDYISYVEREDSYAIRFSTHDFRPSRRGRKRQPYRVNLLINPDFRLDTGKRISIGNVAMRGISFAIVSQVQASGAVQTVTLGYPSRNRPIRAETNEKMAIYAKQKIRGSSFLTDDSVVLLGQKEMKARLFRQNHRRRPKGPRSRPTHQLGDRFELRFPKFITLHPNDHDRPYRVSLKHALVEVLLTRSHGWQRGEEILDHFSLPLGNLAHALVLETERPVCEVDTGQSDIIYPGTLVPIRLRGLRPGRQGVATTDSFPYSSLYWNGHSTVYLRVPYTSGQHRIAVGHGPPYAWCELKVSYPPTQQPI